MFKTTSDHLEKETAGLLIYRSMLRDPLIEKVCRLSRLAWERKTDTAEWEDTLCGLLAGLLAKTDGAAAGENLLQDYLIRFLAGDVNAFSRAAARSGEIMPAASIYRIVCSDLRVIRRLYDWQLPDSVMAGEEITREITCFHPTSPQVREEKGRYETELRRLKEAFAEHLDETELAAVLASFYRRTGCGKFGRFNCFRWAEGEGIVGIAQPEQVSLSDLIGYQTQKETVVHNTEVFLRGCPANNLLLYGDRGTGKSSTVKGLVREFAHQGLRLVEIHRHQLNKLMEAVREVRQEPQHFIFFIDDLSFEAWETDYKYLKALIEGGVEAMPDNVLIYATSNRRHLVQEIWADRAAAGEEIHPGDAMAEKLSLADRFGLTVTYSTPDQEEYLQIVQGLAEQFGITMPRRELRERALQWERWYHGRSGRTARQFVQSLLGSLPGGENLVMEEVLD